MYAEAYSLKGEQPGGQERESSREEEDFQRGERVPWASKNEREEGKRNHADLSPKKMQQFPVAMAKGSHLFPSRTQKLSPSAPMVLGWTRPGRVGRRRIPIGWFYHPKCLNSSMAEHSAVNRVVVGSSPTWGASKR